MWEEIPDIPAIGTELRSHRLNVPGGWIVRTLLSYGVAQTFVSDAQHDWQLPTTSTGMDDKHLRMPSG